MSTDPVGETLAPGTGPGVTLIAVAVEGGLGLVALVLGFSVDHSPLSSISRGAEGLSGHARAMLWGAAATVPMLVALVLVVRHPVGPLRRLTEQVEGLTRELFGGRRLVELAVVAGAAGVGEELLFRGLLQDLLAHWIGAPLGPWVALMVASAVFGLAHPMSLSYVVIAALNGLWLGGLFLATDSLLAPIVAHALYDLIALVYFVRGARGRALGHVPE